MLVEVKVPQLSESVAEATLLAWHKKEGEAVKRDENLIDIETDKVVLELPAPADGVLVKVLKGDGSTVVAGEVIATLDTEAKAAAGAAVPAASAVRSAPAAVPPTPRTAAGSRAPGCAADAVGPQAGRGARGRSDAPHRQRTRRAHHEGGRARAGGAGAAGRARRTARPDRRWRRRPPR